METNKTINISELSLDEKIGQLMIVKPKSLNVFIYLPLVIRAPAIEKAKSSKIRSSALSPELDARKPRNLVIL